MDIRTLIVIVSIQLLSTSGYALEIEEYRVNEIKVVGGSAKLLSHESILLGLSCRSGPVGDLPNLSQVSIGDTITLGKYTFKVGLIEVTKYLEDASWRGNTIAKKGDIVCVVAADEKALPHEDDCEALWVRIPNCLPIH